MMDAQPKLSLIIPFYNQSDTIGRLLDSIEERRFPGLEVIVVDDCSEEDCSEAISRCREKGLPVTLLRHEKRRYTKRARITGILAARGKYIGFADADDVLWGEGLLQKHVELMERNNADVLHFNAVFINDDYTEKKLCQWTVPHAKELSGGDVFRAFVARPNGPAVWCRFFSRDLCLKIAPFAQQCRVLRFGEDMLLTTLLLFHAKKYLSSEEIGYGYRWAPNKAERAAGRMATMYYILTEAAPYLERNGCAPELLDAYKSYILSLMKTWHERVALWLGDEGADGGARLMAIFEHADCEEFLRMSFFLRRMELAAETQKRSDSNIPAQGGAKKLLAKHLRAGVGSFWERWRALRKKL